MDKVRRCGCKGCRTCLLCEAVYGIGKKDFYSIYKKLNSHVFCPKCNCLYPGWDCNVIIENHHNHCTNNGIRFPGILVYENFLTKEESDYLVKNLDDKIPWDNSQSGRRKQNFGPKTNFKKMKLRNGTFNGFPLFTKFIQDRFNEIPLLDNYQTIEQCTLEYNPNNGASIDPHIDDCWIWGERVVTVNCLGDSVLSLIKYNGSNDKYNLHLVDNYRNELNEDLLNENEIKLYEDMVIRIPMPNLSLIVLYGPARYQFEHCVLREDVKERRICIAYREFTPMYLNNGKENEKGQKIIELAKQFWENTNE